MIAVQATLNAIQPISSKTRQANHPTSIFTVYHAVRSRLKPYSCL